MIRQAIPSPTLPGGYAVARFGAAIQPTLECDGFGLLRSAQRHAADLNAAYERQEAANAVATLAPADRPIPKGFYDQD